MERHDNIRKDGGRNAQNGLNSKKCPKCLKNVSENDTECPCCGTPLRAGHEEKNKKIKKKKTPENSLPCNISPAGDTLKKNADTKNSGVKAGIRPMVILKISVCIIFIILILTLIIVAVKAFRSSEGERIAESAAEYIGKDIKTLNNADGDMYFSDNSDHYGVNSAISYDYVMESEKTVRAGGVTYPVWAVFIEVNDNNYVSGVTYTDFSIVEDDMRGKKNGGLIDLGSFSDGDKQSSVTKYIDLNPYSVSYSESGIVTYAYKYYYERENGDEQAVILRASFTSDGKYKYYTSELVYPGNM